ncbi:stage V sporulation protein E [bacterium (Candidatus Gribaldobacteria) CG_4_10_14_0_8_um_filter_33_9]|uniref:Probable peptidoglycan glycosyltransferase FtsW n=1 Tax=bacterium (Candidatus Gribaldobacteria) CG_4_10_14_0_8_um_filter_33_9 TaxID=2014266 RepID=A0A2M7RNG3_9BACT|nr:MAG: stage V sporulation protein E [bacterium (Candidatus Gribaldobacteria) CG_4_10_14_0_8_um_filter_33_9]
MALNNDNYKEGQVDYFLLGILTLLIGWGIFMVFSVSFPFSLERYGNGWHYGLHQLLCGFIPGLFAAFILYKLDLNFLKKISFFLLVLNFICLFLVGFSAISPEIQGAQRWLYLGPISFQPSELLKITFLFYMATWLSGKLETKKSSKKNNLQIFGAFLIMIGLLAGILLSQPDFSTFVIIFSTAFVIYFASRTPWWHSVFLIIAGTGLAAILIKVSPYRLNRILPLFDPQIDPLGIGYQLKQSFITIGSGKLWGIGEWLGLGLSRQKFGFLPHSMTDSIFAIIGEETGFLGCAFLILLFVLFAWRGIKIALNSETEFVKLLGIGITFWLCFQAFANIAGIIGILPLAGIPLPFFSYGASHLIAEMMGIGILLNISKSVK